HHDEEQDRKSDRFQQHRAERRREHLAEGFGGVPEHAAEVVRLCGSHKRRAYAATACFRRVAGTSVASPASTSGGGASSASRAGRSAQCRLLYWKPFSIV